MGPIDVMRLGRGEEIPPILRGRFVFSVMEKDGYTAGSLWLWQRSEIVTFQNGWLRSLSPHVTAQLRYAQRLVEPQRDACKGLFDAGQDFYAAIRFLEILLQSAKAGTSVWYSPTWEQMRRNILAMHGRSFRGETLTQIQQAFGEMEAKALVLRQAEDACFGGEEEEV